jgi:hypothetical protein
VYSPGQFPRLLAGQSTETSSVRDRCGGPGGVRVPGTGDSGAGGGVGARGPPARAGGTVARGLAANPNVFLRTKVQKLGLSPDAGGAALGDAAVVGATYLPAAIVPLWPYFFFSLGLALTISLTCDLHPCRPVCRWDRERPCHPPLTPAVGPPGDDRRLRQRRRRPRDRAPRHHPLQVAESSFLRSPRSKWGHGGREGTPLIGLPGSARARPRRPGADGTSRCVLPFGHMAVPDFPYGEGVVAEVPNRASRRRA